MKKYFSGGHIVEGFCILPSININWMQTSNKTAIEVQFAWLFWYFTVGNVKVILDNWR